MRLISGIYHSQVATRYTKAPLRIRALRDKARKPSPCVQRQDLVRERNAKAKD